MKKILVFQHVVSEGLGSLEPFLRRHGIEVEFAQMFTPTTVPEDPRKYSMAISMGGPMNVDDMDRYPFLKDEFDFLSKALSEKVPTLGICLGAQMVASALGAKVYRGTQKEIGWFPIQFAQSVSNDPVFGPLAKENPVVFHWHGYTFDIPKGAELLASSKLYPNQAFRFSHFAYGLQFHIEINQNMVEEWIRVNREELESAELLSVVSQIVRDSKRNAMYLSDVATTVYKNLFGHFGLISHSEKRV